MLSPVTTIMYRPSTVLTLLAAVTFLLSLVLFTSVGPAPVGAACADSIFHLVALPHAIYVCVRHVLSFVPRSLNVDRLTRACSGLSALAAASDVELVIVKALERFHQLLTLSRSICRFLFCMTFLVWLLMERIAEVVFDGTFPYLGFLCSSLWIICVCCVHIVLCSAPIIVFYCVILDANPDIKRKQEPVLGIQYAIVRRRKLPRMLRERYQREREQALQREEERQQARLVTELSPKTDPPETGPSEPPQAEGGSHHPAKRGDVETAGPAPIVSTRETGVESCEIVIPPLPPSPMSPPLALSICSGCVVSSALTNPPTPASSARAHADSTATSAIEHPEDPSLAEGATLLLSECSKESKLNGSSIAGENDTWGLDSGLSTPDYSGNFDIASTIQHEVITASDPFTVASCAVSSSTTAGLEADKLPQSGAEISVEKRVDFFNVSDTVVLDILGTPGMAALIQAAVEDLGSTMANNIVEPPLPKTNQISTNEDAACTESTAATVCSHIPQGNPHWNARPLEDGAGRSDVVFTTSPAQDTSGLPPTDVDMTPEQVDEVLELLGAELARTNGDLDPDLGLGASKSIDITPASPPVSSSLPTTDADLQALDALWESMGINPVEPEYMDIDFGVITDTDFNASTADTSDSGTRMDLEFGVYAPGEPIPVLPTDNTVLNLTGPAVECGVEMSDEECLEFLVQLCEEPIGTIVGDMGLDETRATLTATPNEQQAMAQLPDSGTLSCTLGTPGATECDVSMSDEECIAQLAELCKDITPATNPEVGLEQTLAMLSGLVGGTTGGAASQDATSPKYDLVRPEIEGGPVLTGWSGCMRLEDVMDWAIVVDAAGGVGTSESEDGSVTKAGWRRVETCEEETMSRLDMDHGIGVKDLRK